MSNETDLDWLARNVHVWPAGDHQPWCYVYWKCGQRAVSGNCITVIQPCVRVEMSDWLARRAELQNKPSWADAPEWAEWLAQDEDGEWKWLAGLPVKYVDGWAAVKIKGHCKGLALDDWRDTLEKRPEQTIADICREVTGENRHEEIFEPFVSVDDSLEKEMKRDDKWFERGDLPPVGCLCLYVVSDRLSAEVEITAHAKFGLCFVEVGKSGENYVSKTAELHRFRPIPTERDALIEIIKNTDDTDDKIADAILAAGFSLRGK